MITAGFANSHEIRLMNPHRVVFPSLEIRQGMSGCHVVMQHVHYKHVQYNTLYSKGHFYIALFLIGRIHYGLMKVRQRSCRSCTCRRSLPIIHRWQYYGAGARYQSVPTDNCEVDDNNDNDDDSLTDKILGNVTPTIHMSPVKDVELSYAHTFSDIHKKAGSNTKLRRITEKGIMLDLKN